MTTEALVELVSIDRTERVVTSVNQPNTVTALETERVVAKVSEGQVIVTGMLGIPAARSIGASTDVDITQVEDGSVLVYNDNRNMWVATTQLEKQYIDGGFF